MADSNPKTVPEKMESPEIIMKQYLISEDKGFLIDCSQVQLDGCWARYLAAIENLDSFVGSKQFRDHVKNKLDERDLVYPEDKKQLLRLHKILTFLTSGFVWQDGDQNVPDRLPRCLSIPLCNVSKALVVKPILSYPTMILANWKMKDDNGDFVLENLEAIFKTPSENPVAAEWFILIHVMVEYKFAPAIKAIIEAVRCTCESHSEENDRKLITALEVIPKVMQDMIDTFRKITENVTPEIFFDKLMTFYIGWGWGNPPLPNGLIYEGVDDDKCQMMRDGSGAQSTTLQVIDAAFGINHKKDEDDFLTEKRDYMLKEHREFYEWVKEKSRIRNYATSCCVEVKEGFNKCIDAVKSFRKEHLSKVHDYVKNPSQRQNKNKKVETVEDKGTGSTPYLTFLNNVRRDANASRLTISED